MTPSTALFKFLKERLDEFHRWVADAFDAGKTAETLVDARRLYIDQLLQQLLYYHGFAHAPHTALVAVGRYGRDELHPLSDIDVLVLSQAPLTPPL